MRRRDFITLVGGTAAWPLAARAQQPKVWRIGVLAGVPPTPAMLSAFRDGMRGRGYVEGQNLSIDVRWPQGSFDQDPSVVTELVNSNVDVIVAWGTPATIAARRATLTIPIVMASVGDPVGSGFIASLARPGGNITGLSNIQVDLSAKLMELFAELVPGMKRVGVVHNPNNPQVTMALRETEDAIRKLNMQVQVVNAQTSDEFDRAFAQLSAESVGGVVVLANPTVIEHSRRIAELAQSARLPTAFSRRENVDAGGLLSYGADLNNAFRQSAFYVDRILKGEKPADLPVMQPTKVELVINLKTAKALGVTVPLIMQMTADELIE
ncbi:MAG: ABC transporter substrate-binding protein [Terrimicrobiaceae bacterium]|jgi:putative tryptophan/tyrosine transport system substrate-binding protein